MGFMSQIGGLLQQYSGASAASPPENVERDFQQVAPQVPQAALSGGLSEAFRSKETPPFGQMVSQLFGQSNGEQRAGILNRLMGAVGTAGLSGSVLGGLSSLMQGRTPITPDQAQQVSPDAVQHLAEHAEKNDPSIIDRASEFYAQHPTLVQGLGAGALALVMSRISQHR
ncbi:MAG: hypothetical protein JWO80_6478 [Bryobacterales bacterium]|nr:hypothetical protein [Bryobacterales bacterium]